MILTKSSTKLLKSNLGNCYHDPHLSITKLVETDNILLSYVISSINNFFSKKKKKSKQSQKVYTGLSISEGQQTVIILVLGPLG